MDKSEMTIEDIEAALYSLSDEDRENIERIAADLVKKAKARYTGKGTLFFGRHTALELLAKLGMFAVEHPKLFS